MNFTLALGQIDPALGNLNKNIVKHLAMVERARAGGAHLIVFPELSLTGYSIKDLNWDLALNIERDVSPLQLLLDASRSISIVAGGVEESQGFGIYNSAFYFSDGTVRTVHRKIYPPTYGMFEEMRYFSRGRTVRAFDTAQGRLGVLICEDLWHISLPYILALDGAQIILALAASPTRIGSNEKELGAASVNMEHHRAYARLLSTYVAFCNRVGYEDGVGFWGGSGLVGPDGSVDAQAKLLDEDLVFATVNDDEVRRARRFSRHFLDEDPGVVAAELERIQKKGKEYVP